MAPRKKTPEKAIDTAVAETLANPESATAQALEAKGRSLVIPDQVQAELNMIERLASNPRADVKKLESLLEMRERNRAIEARLQFNKAMRDCQAEIMPVVRDAENAHTKSRYAKLEKIDKMIRPIYTKHGFSLTFNSKSLDNKQVRVFCTCMHDDGHFQEYELDGALDTAGSKGNSNKTDLQGLGSTVSYLRRYLTCMIFNVVLTNEDDDGGKPPEKGADKFDEKLRAQHNKGQQAAPAGKVSDATFTEVPPEGESWGIDVGAPVRPARFRSAVKAGQYLKGALAHFPDKKKRLDILLDHTNLLQAIERAGDAELVASLHATANMNGGDNG